MSGRGNSITPKLDLELNLSPPRANPQVPESPNTSSSSCELSVESSCVSSEPDQETTSNMLLVGCPRCLMYVMLSEVNPKCPKCKSSVLLDFLNEEKFKKTTN